MFAYRFVLFFKRTIGLDLYIRPCVVVVNQYNAPIMGRFTTRVIPVSMGHYSIKWCSGALFQ
ncbi:hypothetical protein Hanom_Chr06g00562751 [Helianthus anomalus]